jgi:hypothetical protein
LVDGMQVSSSQTLGRDQESGCVTTLVRPLRERTRRYPLLMILLLLRGQISVLVVPGSRGAQSAEFDRFCTGLEAATSFSVSHER